VAEDGSLKVADFGIAKSIDGLDLTETGEILGTAAYIAPERLEGQTATFRSDVYSLGVVAYEALTGTKPFVADTPAAIAYAVHNTEPVPVRHLRPDADPDLAAAVERAMARDPADRFESADAMAEALDPDAARDGSAGDITTGSPTSGDVAAEGATGVLTPTDVLVASSAAPTTAVPRARRRIDKRPLIGLAVVAGVVVIAVTVNNRTDSPGAIVPDAGPATTAAPAPLATALDRLDEAIHS
jgi:serine/threonine-protein kinase